MAEATLVDADGMVVIVIEPDADYEPEAGLTVMDLPEESPAGIGWTWSDVDADYVAPPPEPEPPLP